MELVSLNVGLPRTVTWHGQPVTTGIFKAPVSDPVMLRTLNFDGDRQADLTVHGGRDKAVYGYAADHYPYWRAALPDLQFPFGAFGENLTVRGLREDAVHIGDHYRLGAAELVVTQPRLPCYKLGVRFGRAEMVKRFLTAKRYGVYFAVAREGMVAPGDHLERLSQDPQAVTVADLARVYLHDKEDVAVLRRAVAVPALPDGWRETLLERLGRLGD